RRIAPSSVNYTGYRPDEISLYEIETIKSSFVKAAQFANLANFDGIELHGAHGYLLQEFFSPALNKRDDKYGGTFEGRLRLAQEVIDEIREKLSIPIGIRLSLYEDDLNGYSADYGAMIANSLRNIDYVHLSAGRFAPPGSSASFYTPKTHVFDKMVQKPNVTTMVVGSITNVGDVEKVLQVADFVSIGRGFLADPYLVKKFKADPNLLRPCIRCNQACRNLSYGEVRCTVNPDTGFEFYHKYRKRYSGEIEIAGAGVKGIEAAISAAKSGLSVILYDRKDRIGGQILDIYDEFKKKEFSTLLSYYGHVLDALNVQFVPETEYRGKGLYCYPDTVYPEIVPKDHIIIDSNIYRYYDDALRMAEETKITMTDRSLLWLDRTRRDPYRIIAMQKGIEFVPETDEKPDIGIIETDQYDIGAAIISGRESLRTFMEKNENDYL
ncbi:MAG: FAD-dependent oxidoreductase, partial [Thermoplasmata archaeon]